MLAEELESWTEQWKREGLEEGRRKGLQEGRQEGAARLLVHLAKRRFGALTEAQHTLVQQAGLTQLEAWSDQIAD